MMKAVHHHHLEAFLFEAFPFEYFFPNLAFLLFLPFFPLLPEVAGVEIVGAEIGASVTCGEVGSNIVVFVGGVDGTEVMGAKVG